MSRWPSASVIVAFTFATAAKLSWISWSAPSCAAGDRRLLGVGVVPLDDTERAVAEIDLAIKAGCKLAIAVSEKI